MKALLKKIQHLYKGQVLEYQYALVIDQSQKLHIKNISFDNKRSSSVTSFTELASFISSFNNQIIKIFIVHNHPGLNTPLPSNMDYKNANLICALIAELGYEVTDYLIYSRKGYYSFAESNELSNFLEAANDLNIKFLDKKFSSYSDLEGYKDEISSYMRLFNVVCVGFSKNANNLLFPLEFKNSREQNTIVKSVTFISETIYNAKTIQFIKALYPSDLTFIYKNSGEWTLIV